MIFVLLLCLALAGFGAMEFRRQQRTILRIPRRIHVNGTRGKSSVTRLITGGLQSGGIVTLGKTTGTKPCVISPDGREHPIARVGKANIIEQVRITRRAASLGVDAIVMECMAVLPQNQRIAEMQMVHSTIGVITNVRADHLDEMGPTVEDVARSLSNTIPLNGDLFTCEEKYLPMFSSVARGRNTQVHHVQSDGVTGEMMGGFTYIEHRENVALALAVCTHLGVPRDAALAGMKRAVPDPGVLRIFDISYFQKSIGFVNAFAANDPDSYLIIWDLLEPNFSPARSILVIVNCRKDRIQRTESLAGLIAKKLRADHFLLVGEFTTPLLNRAISLGLPASKISNLAELTPDEVFQRIVALTSEASLVIGIGNIVGFGEELVSNFTNRGKEHVY